MLQFYSLAFTSILQRHGRSRCQAEEAHRRCATQTTQIYVALESKANDQGNVPSTAGSRGAAIQVQTLCRSIRSHRCTNTPRPQCHPLQEAARCRQAIVGAVAECFPADTQTAASTVSLLRSSTSRATRSHLRILHRRKPAEDQGNQERISWYHKSRRPQRTLASSHIV